MGAKIITKTDRQMEDRLHAVASDPERADTLQKAALDLVAVLVRPEKF